MPAETVQSKARWADDGEEDEYEGPTETFENGIKTITERKINDKGQKVQVIKRIRVYTKTVRRNKNVEARKLWKKFGECAGVGAGLEAGITTESLDEFLLVLGGPQKLEEAPGPSSSVPATAVCRTCSKVGDHWTNKCPLKPSDKSERDLVEPEVGNDGKLKYVVPSRRAGAVASSGGDDRGRRGGDDVATVRVTNLSEDTKENDLSELFRPFGAISRIYLAKDKESNISRGFAFVSFVRKEDAARAIDKLSGYGYDHLILHLEWAKPSK